MNKAPGGLKNKSQSKRPTPEREVADHVFSVELAGTETERLFKEQMQEDLNH